MVSLRRVRQLSSREGLPGYERWQQLTLDERRAVARSVVRLNGVPVAHLVGFDLDKQTVTRFQHDGQRYVVKYGERGPQIQLQTLRGVVEVDWGPTVHEAVPALCSGRG